jgi:guanylate kinase
MTDTVVQPSEEPKQRSKKLMVPPEKWAEVERAWANGKFATVALLAQHFELPAAKVQERLLRQGITKGQSIEEYNRAVQAELEKRAQEDARVIAERISETRDEHYKMAHAITKFTYNELMKCHQGKLPFAGAKQNLASLESAMKVLKMAREERFAVLGVGDGTDTDQEQGTPELVINELTPEKIEELKSRSIPSDDEEEEIIEMSGELFEGEPDEGEEDE